MGEDFCAQEFKVSSSNEENRRGSSIMIKDKDLKVEFLISVCQSPFFLVHGPILRTIDCTFLQRLLNLASGLGEISRFSLAQFSQN